MNVGQIEQQCFQLADVTLQAFAGGRIVYGNDGQAGGFQIASHPAKLIFVAAEAVQQQDAPLGRRCQLKYVAATFKSSLAFGKAAACPPDVPVVEQTIMLCQAISLDSPLLIIKYIFPQLAAAKRKKNKGHAEISLLVAINRNRV